MKELGTAVTSADVLCKGDQGRGDMAHQFKGCFPMATFKNHLFLHILSSHHLSGWQHSPASPTLPPSSTKSC